MKEQRTLDKYKHEELEILGQNELYIAFKAGIIGQREVWILTGDYKQLKEMPDVEKDLPDDIKESLCISRLLARPRFRGVVANKPVTLFRDFKGVFISSVRDEI